VSGDITATCGRLGREDLVLTFIDTDNCTPAKAAIDVVSDRTRPGGAMVDDPRWFHLHGTGVFYRQGTGR
jgi:hypothetical protein